MAGEPTTRTAMETGRESNMMIGVIEPTTRAVTASGLASTSVGHNFGPSHRSYKGGEFILFYLFAPSWTACHWHPAPLFALVDEGGLRPTERPVVES